MRQLYALSEEIVVAMSPSIMHTENSWNNRSAHFSKKLLLVSGIVYRSACM